MSVSIDAWPAKALRIFQLPVYYPDNPAGPVKGMQAADLDVRDVRGVRIPARDTATGEAGEGPIVVLPEGAHTFAYSVDLDPDDPARSGLPFPGLAPGVDAVDGAYFFAIPVLAQGLAARWRMPVRITLEIDAPGRTLVGVEPRLELDSPYELMFVRAAFDPPKSASFPADGHELVVYALSDTAFDSGRFADLLAQCLRLVEDSILPLPGYRYFAGQNPVFWGVEGISGYWFNSGAAADPMVQTHELIHTFVGIRNGDIEDPWWKEGMSQYLGFLLPTQAGLIGDTAFAREVLADHDTVPAVRRMALSDPGLRTRLFPPLDSAWVFVPDPMGYEKLVYGKGGQASMILDRWIVSHSGGLRSVYDLMRGLNARHGPGFSRADLIAETEKLAGVPSRAFLEDLLDRPGAFPPDSLRSTYAALRSLGRFGPQGGRLPVPGVDGPAAKSAVEPSAPGVTHPLPGPDVRRGKW